MPVEKKGSPASPISRASVAAQQGDQTGRTDRHAVAQAIRNTPASQRNLPPNGASTAKTIAQELPILPNCVYCSRNSRGTTMSARSSWRTLTAGEQIGRLRISWSLMEHIALFIDWFLRPATSEPAISYSRGPEVHMVPVLSSNRRSKSNPLGMSSNSSIIFMFPLKSSVAIFPSIRHS